jgi:hypothetical protein
MATTAYQRDISIYKMVVFTTAIWQDRTASVAAALDMAMPRPSAKVTDMLPYVQSMTQPNNAFHVQVRLNKPREASPWNGSGGWLLDSERRALGSISEQSK